MSALCTDQSKNKPTNQVQCLDVSESFDDCVEHDHFYTRRFLIKDHGFALSVCRLLVPVGPGVTRGAFGWPWGWDGGTRAQHPPALGLGQRLGQKRLVPPSLSAGCGLSLGMQGQGGVFRDFPGFSGILRGFPHPPPAAGAAPPPIVPIRTSLG